jgi:hypothetical protein
MIAAWNSLDLPIVQVSQIPTDVTAEDFSEFFGLHGNIVHASLLPPEPGGCFQTGFVTMNTTAECDVLIKRLNYGSIRNQMYLMARYIDDVERQRLEQYELRLEGVPAERPPGELRRYLETVGPVYQFKILTDPMDELRVFGRVTFFNKDTAYAVRCDRRFLAEFCNSVSMSVCNLMPDTTMAMVEAIFSSKTITDPPLTIELAEKREGWPRRAIVTFLTPEDVQAAGQFGNRQFIGSIKLSCRSRTAQIHDPFLIAQSGVMLRGVSRRTDWVTIANMCVEFGKVTDIKRRVMDGIARISFVEIQTSRRAARELNGSVCQGCPLTARVWYSRHYVLALRLRIRPNETITDDDEDWDDQDYIARQSRRAANPSFASLQEPLPRIGTKTIPVPLESSRAPPIILHCLLQWRIPHTLFFHWRAVVDGGTI